jgi:hypothetical protein
MIVWGMMDAGINNVIYMEIHSGAKMTKRYMQENDHSRNDKSRFHCIINTLLGILFFSILCT